MKGIALAVFIALAAGSGCARSRAVHAAPELAYSRLTNGHWQIWICDTEGQQPEQLTFDPSDKRNPQWTADGTDIFFRNGNQEPFVIELADRRPRPILRCREPLISMKTKPRRACRPRPR